MEGKVKALESLAGKPLLSHVIDRISPQVNTLLLSVERHCDALGVFGLLQVADQVPDGGPLGGLLAGLRMMDTDCDWLLLVPCDAPFIPAGLAAGLLHCAEGSGQAGAVIRYQSEIQPTFSIWHRSVTPRLERAVDEEGMGGFKQFLKAVDVAELDWPKSEPSPFFNINDKDALLEASSRVSAVSG